MDLFKELKRINAPRSEVDQELEKEAARQMKIVDDAIAAFSQAVDQLLATYVDKFGAGQIMEYQNTDIGERRAWVVPIQETDEMTSHIEKLRSNYRFREWIDLFKAACPLPPHQAQVVQYKKDDEFRTVYRLRDDFKLGL